MSSVAGAALAALLQAPELAAALGGAAGLSAAGRLAAASRLHGGRVGELLPRLGESLLQLVAVGGEGPDGASRASCECLSLADGSWRPLPPTHVRRAGCAAAVLDGRLYVVGGDGNDFETLSTVECLAPGRAGHLAHATWIMLPPMGMRRAEHVAVAVAGAVYAVGGNNGVGLPSASAERFDPAVGIWQPLPPMNTPRAGCAGAVAGGQFYIVGGYGEDGITLATTERFDPEAGTWRSGSPPLRAARCRCAAAVVAGRLCVAGGQGGFDRQPLASVERLDVGRGASAWEELPPLQQPRWACAAVPLAGALCVLGGFRGGFQDSSGSGEAEPEEPLASAERLDQGATSWRALPPLRAARGLLAAAVLACPRVGTSFAISFASMAMGEAITPPRLGGTEVGDGEEELAGEEYETTAGEYDDTTGGDYATTTGGELGEEGDETAEEESEEEEEENASADGLEG